ncbi:MAG: ABC transporter substrate-binding protein [Gammaproteobacteria bacterium]|nr:ABC transporter substrate-binding protein [Gammaproteobacteria bacterium]
MLSGCFEPPQEALRIASSPWPGYEPLYLARDLGYLDNQNVNLFELPSSDITMESFRNRSTDLATLTLDETLELLHDGTKLRILLALDISHGGDAVLVSPEIKQLADLKGKRIAIVNIPLGIYMLNRLLDKAGLERNQVTVFPMSESKQEKFYLDGKADAVITFEPVKTRLKDAGAHVIFDSSMIPNEIFDLLLVHEDVYLKRKTEICDIARGWFKTLRYMDEHTDDAAARITRRLGVDIDSYAGMMDGIRQPDQEDNFQLLSGNTPGIFKSAGRLQKIMLTEKQLNHAVNISDAIDGSFASCYTK